MIPQRIPNPMKDAVTIEDVCALREKWGLHPDLAARLVRMAGTVPFDLSIFSGARSREEQARLEEAGKPTAPFDLSTHANETADGCPRLATGADVWPTLPGVRAIDVAAAQLGAAAATAGLRWGGGSPVDSAGIPSDRWHFDLGPRATAP